MFKNRQAGRASGGGLSALRNMSGRATQSGRQQMSRYTGPDARPASPSGRQAIREMRGQDKVSANAPRYVRGIAVSQQAPARAVPNVRQATPTEKAANQPARPRNPLGGQPQERQIVKPIRPEPQQPAQPQSGGVAAIRRFYGRG